MYGGWQFHQAGLIMYEIIHSKFEDLIIPGEPLELIWDGGRWTEGPVYHPQFQTLIWSDIPNNKLMAFNELSGESYVFRSACGYQNGHTLDAFGRIVACEHGSRSVTRQEFDGTWKTLANTFQGKRFNSPNDVTVAADGSIWFTDPTYGIDFNHLGQKAESETGTCGVYCLKPETGELSLVISELRQPNGVAFSPDSRWLYVSDSGTTHDASFTSVIMRYPFCITSGTCGKGEVFAECQHGVFDGFRFDGEGRLFTSSQVGVEVYDNELGLIGRLRTPECVANLCFGGEKRNRLYITATRSLYAVYLNTNS